MAQGASFAGNGHDIGYARVVSSWFTSKWLRHVQWHCWVMLLVKLRGAGVLRSLGVVDHICSMVGAVIKRDHKFENFVG